MAVLAGFCVVAAYRVGYRHGRVFEQARAVPISAPRLFVGESRPYPVNSWSAEFRFTGAMELR